MSQVVHGRQADPVLAGPVDGQIRAQRHADHAEGHAAVDTGNCVRVEHDLGLGRGIYGAALDLIRVLNDPNQAVRVVAGEVRVREVIGNG